MAKSLIENNTQIALNLSNEIEKLNSRFNSFITTLSIKDKQHSLNTTNFISKKINSEYKSFIDYQKQVKDRQSEVEKVESQVQVSENISSQPILTSQQESFNIEKVIATATTLGGVSLIGGMSETLPLTGDNGRMKPDQLIAIGNLSSSPEGGPYWYGNTAYLRKKDAGPAFLAAKKSAEKDGVTFIINSAYRSLEHQKSLQRKYSVVASAGSSPHGDGIALDIQTNTAGWNWMVKNGSKFGWKYIAIPNDEVHFEYVGGGQSSIDTVKKKDDIPSKTNKASNNKILLTQPKETITKVNNTKSNISNQLNNTKTGVTREQILFSTI